MLILTVDRRGIIFPPFRLDALELAHNGADNVVVDGVNAGEGVRL